MVYLVIAYSSPAVANGVVYVGSVEPDGSLYAINANTGTLRWRYTTGDDFISSPAVANGVVYVGCDDHNLYALNASTGTLLWNHTMGYYVESSPTVANGVVYVGSNEGNLWASCVASSRRALLWSCSNRADLSLHRRAGLRYGVASSVRILITRTQ